MASLPEESTSDREAAGEVAELGRPEGHDSSLPTNGSEVEIEEIEEIEESTADDLLIEEELMGMEEQRAAKRPPRPNKSSPKTKESPKANGSSDTKGAHKSETTPRAEVEPGTIMWVPRIFPRGVTVERLKGSRHRVASNIEMIAVKDDRIGPMEKLGRNHYLQLIMPLHVELLKLQNWVKENRLRVVLLFEGRDAAGKGGTIKRFVEHMNPRGSRVVALDKPTDEERGQWYFQRYVQHLPTAGEIVLFDRSWYNRAMVERVMGFCKGDDVREFLRSVPEFERMLIRSGIILLKYYFSVSKKEQLRRFQKRLDDPLKQWKLSPVDLESQDKWDEYKKSKEDMFFYTSTADSPWVIIKSDEKKRARINAIRHFLGRISYPKDYPHMLGVDHRIIKTAKEELAAGI